MKEKQIQTKPYQYLSLWENPSNKSISPSTIVVSCFLQLEDKVLVLQRAKKDIQHKLWGIPGGKLENDEPPILGLIRELSEETTIELLPYTFQLLGTARCCTQCDGEYGLYVYHAKITKNHPIQLNDKEHYAYKWVTIEEFQKLNLLTAQGDAFYFVKNELIKIMQ